MPQKSLQLTEQDLDYFEAIYDLQGYVTVPQLTALFPSSKVIQGQSKGGLEGKTKRLRKLVQHGYLKLIEGMQPLTYTLDYPAAHELSRSRAKNWSDMQFQINAIRKYLNTGSHKLSHLKHRQGINDFRLSLFSALRESHKADWLRDDNTDTPLWLEPMSADDKKRFTVTIKRADIVPVANIESKVSKHTLTRLPDATFILKPDKTQDHTVAYLYEKDRGTEQHSTIARKLLAYLHWHKQKQHRRFFATNTCASYSRLRASSD